MGKYLKTKQNKTKNKGKDGLDFIRIDDIFIKRCQEESEKGYYKVEKFAIHISDKELIIRMHKELLKHRHKD